MQPERHRDGFRLNWDLRRKKREGDSNRRMEKKGGNRQVDQDSQEHQKSQEQAKRGAKKVHDQHSRYIQAKEAEGRKAKSQG